MSDDPKSPAMRVASLSVPDLVALLGRSGAKRATEAAIRADVAAGAPTNEDGSINLIHYAAWLARAESHGA